MKAGITLLLLGLAEIAVGGYSWWYCSEIIAYRTASGRIVDETTGRIKNKRVLGLRYEFIVDGRPYEGSYLEQLGDLESSPQRVKLLYGPDGGLTVRYDPLKPQENTLRLPNTWHAIIAVCVGIYCIALSIWALVNLTVLKLGETDASRKTHTGPAKVLKCLLAGIAVVLLPVAFFTSPLYTTETGCTIMLLHSFFVLAGLAAIVVPTGVIICQLPLFCWLAQSKTCNQYWDEGLRIIRRIWKLIE